MAGSSGQFTVVVAGAGPVGLALAALLATGPAAKQLEIYVADAGSQARWRKDRMDIRVYALSRASQDVLERVGAWSWMSERRVSPYRRMRIWQGRRWGGRGSLEFDCADIGERDLGHIVEDRLIRAAFVHVLAKQPKVHLLMGSGVDDVELRADTVAVGLDSGQVLDGSVLIATDGADSPIRDMVGIGVTSRDYGQRALVTHIETELPHRETAWQRFLPGGPLAFLPLSDGRSSVVWSLPDDRAKEIGESSNAQIIESLQQASGDVLGRIESMSSKAMFPLHARHATSYCRQRLALAGDAAHSVHPLAGQGMNLGLLDAACLATVIERAIDAGEDPGDLRVLRRYERGRKADNVGMLLALDLIDRAFRMPAWFEPLSAAGLGAVDSMSLAKEMLMRHALGTSAIADRAA